MKNGELRVGFYLNLYGRYKEMMIFNLGMTVFITPCLNVHTVVYGPGNLLFHKSFLFRAVARHTCLPHSYSISTVSYFSVKVRHPLGKYWTNFSDMKTGGSEQGKRKASHSLYEMVSIHMI